MKKFVREFWWAFTHSGPYSDYARGLNAGRAENKSSGVVIQEAGEAVSEIMMFSHASGLETPGCNCGHDTLGPDWHLSGCPWPKRAWRAKAFELAERRDAET